jgi:hypothetical protein
MSGIEISRGRGLCSMMKCSMEATQHIRVSHARDSSESHLWACTEHFPQVEQFARNIVNGAGLEFFIQLAPRAFRIVVDDPTREERPGGSG